VKANEIATAAIARLNRRITNEVFLTIQNDRELMLHYLRAVEKDGLDTVNQQIGRAVKAAYQLMNANERENNPSCTLIQSHQIFD
jgi:hypothetical protein